MLYNEYIEKRTTTNTEGYQMKRRIRITVKNVILMVLLAINVVVAFVCGAMLDIEQFLIPLAVGAIAFGFVALFYFVNEDLIIEMIDNN